MVASLLLQFCAFCLFCVNVHCLYSTFLVWICNKLPLYILRPLLSLLRWYFYLCNFVVDCYFSLQEECNSACFLASVAFEQSGILLLLYNSSIILVASYYFLLAFILQSAIVYNMSKLSYSLKPRCLILFSVLLFSFSYLILFICFCPCWGSQLWHRPQSSLLGVGSLSSWGAQL